MKEQSKGMAHFFNAFGYSMSGLKFMLKESAFRQELALGVVHFVALALLDLPRMTGVVLSALWAAVLIVEMLNTAVEAVVDLVSPEYHELAKKAKDIGSAAVWVALVGFFVAWTAAIAFNCK